MATTRARQETAYDLLVDRSHLDRTTVVDGPPPDLGEGQALLRVERFGLTANNITYAAMGDALRYWEFFPAAQPWGRVPAWGFATVVASTHDDVPEGTRVYGYVPMGSYLVVTPRKVGAEGFADGTPHRSTLPPAYNAYRRLDTDPVYDPELEGQQLVLLPLFLTSFLLDDVLGDGEGGKGSDTVVLSSASSKTAIGTAFLLARRPGVEVVGLTSPRNAAFVEGLGLYDRVVPYDALAAGDAGDTDGPDGGPGTHGRASFVDLAGDPATRRRVHERYGAALERSIAVGATHHERALGGLGGGGSGDAPTPPLPGPEPTFFFAPDRLRTRTAEWGRQAFDTKLGLAWKEFATASRRWLSVEEARGPDAVRSAFLDLVAGRVGPEVGLTASLPARSVELASG